MKEINNTYFKCQYLKSTLFVIFMLLSSIYVIKEISITNGNNITLKINLKENLSTELDKENLSTVLDKDFDDGLRINKYIPESYINNKTKSFLISLVKNATKNCKVS